MLRREGYTIGRPKTADKNTSIVSIMNLSWNTENTENTQKLSRNPCKESTSKNSVLGILSIPEQSFCSICSSPGAFIIENEKPYCPDCVNNKEIKC
jgi:hypothetical protein